MMRQRLTTGAMVLALFSPSSASAHAILVRSIPAQNATVFGPKFTVELVFNSRVDQSRSTLVLEGDGNEGTPLVVVKNSEQPAMLSALVSNLKQGSYKLHWQVLAIDGHITRGTVIFRVR
jgi:hypothetical protein